MNLETLRGRVNDLSAAFPTLQAEDVKTERLRRFFARLNIDELRRLRDIKRRKEMGQPPTMEERQWLDELQAKHGHIRRGHESL